MRLPMSQLGGARLLVGLLTAAALLAAACGGDQQQAAAPEIEQQPQAEPTAPSESETEPKPEPQQQAAQDMSETPSPAAAPQASEQQQSSSAAATESVPEGTRLITLFGDLTEIVYALGAQEYLVARDVSSIYPAEAETLPNLGFAGTLNAEAILALEPTLVIGTHLAGPAGVLEQLQSAGVEVLLLEAMREIDAPRRKIEAIGAALGIPQTAVALADDVERRLAEASAEAESLERPLRVLHVYIRRGGVQLVSGAGNEAQTIIEAAGAIDAAAETGIVGWESLTPEALVAIDPEVYLVMDRGLEVIGGIEKLLEIPGMAETRAGRGQHVVSLPDLELLLGPRLPETVAELIAALRAIEAEIGSQ